jgi:hypothetical protein
MISGESEEEDDLLFDASPPLNFNCSFFFDTTEFQLFDV